ncbi:hypothetical protein L914_08829 [Phytophthora nicotianae]|uniref:Uncharacterized protein n=2 Tax=Phytophthora nicotianae TaxID=4792 RepID=W2NCC5_PHYNI|nr:hypothetical protein L914_08829 [Phytophthora nicotianae]
MTAEGIVCGHPLVTRMLTSRMVYKMAPNDRELHNDLLIPKRRCINTVLQRLHHREVKCSLCMEHSNRVAP